MCVLVFYELNCTLFVPLFFQYIVITFDEEHFEGGEVVPPFEEKLVFAVVAAMEKVAGKEYLPGFEELYLCYEPLHIFFKGALRYCNTRFTEMPAFAEVGIGDDQCTRFLPEEATVGAQPKGLFMYGKTVGYHTEGAKVKE